MLLGNRLTNGDFSFSKQFFDTLIGQSASPPCYFYAPEVDRMIDNFFIANGVKRQYQCNKCDPVVNSEKNWLETHQVDATLIESFFSILAEYYNKRMDNPIRVATAKVNFYNYSIFRTLVPDKFDIMAYLLRNKDVLVANIDPYKHYVLYGYTEGRPYDWGLVSS